MSGLGSSNALTAACSKLLLHHLQQWFIARVSLLGQLWAPGTPKHWGEMSPLQTLVGFNTEGFNCA